MIHLSPAQKREELSILKSEFTSVELYSSLVEHIASTIENDNKKHYGSVIQKDLVAWERAHVKLTNIVKREIFRIIRSVGVTQVSASGSGQSSSSGSDYMIPASNSVEGSVSAQADTDDADEDELSSYPMFEGTLNELCEAIQNYNGEEGGDETYSDCDNSDEEGIC
jgi:hypothetical protein